MEAFAIETGQDISVALATVAAVGSYTAVTAFQVIAEERLCVPVAAELQVGLPLAAMQAVLLIISLLLLNAMHGHPIGQFVDASCITRICNTVHGHIYLFRQNLLLYFTYAHYQQEPCTTFIHSSNVNANVVPIISSDETRNCAFMQAKFTMQVPFVCIVSNP